MNLVSKIRLNNNLAYLMATAPMWMLFIPIGYFLRDVHISALKIMALLILPVTFPTLLCRIKILRGNTLNWALAVLIIASPLIYFLSARWVFSLHRLDPIAAALSMGLSAPPLALVGLSVHLAHLTSNISRNLPEMEKAAKIHFLIAITLVLWWFPSMFLFAR